MIAFALKFYTILHDFVDVIFFTLKPFTKELFVKPNTTFEKPCHVMVVLVVCILLVGQCSV